MSLKQMYKDVLTLGAIIGLIIIIIGVFYQYFTAHDTYLLYIGIIITLLMILGTLARYGFVIDYVKTLFES
jgi:hypothetical protein